MSQPLEGWGVTARPAVIALALFVLVLVAGIVAAAAWYRADIAPETRPRLTYRPSPALETIDTAPSDLRELAAPQPPDGIRGAMATTAARGDALWGRP